MIQTKEMEQLDNKTKWCYSVGGLGRDMAYTLVSMFLITYIQYTMQLTAAQFTAITVIIVLCRIWDAINDPMMGTIIENCHFKSGKFRPWILIGVLTNAAVIIALFTIRPTGWGFVAFFGVAYLLWGMTYTMNDISYWGMLPSLTSDPKQRNSVTTLMVVFASIGAFVVAGVLPMLVAGNAIKMYAICAIGVALCFVGFQLLTFFGAKERRRIEQVGDDKLSLKGMFKVLFRNDQLIVIGIVTLLYSLGSGLLVAFGMNFFYFQFGYAEGGSNMFLFTVMYAIGTLVSQALYPLIAKKWSRRKILNFSSILSCIGYLALLGFGYLPFLPANGILLDFIGLVIFFGQGLFYMVILMMLNNTIEYDEWKYNKRHDSIISAVRSFTVKLAGAIQQGVITLVLIISGIYAFSQEIANLEILGGKGELTAEQIKLQADAIIKGVSENQMLILRIGMVVVPLLMFIACYILIIKKYKIDEKMYEKMVNEINERNAKLLEQNTLETK